MRRKTVLGVPVDGVSYSWQDRADGDQHVRGAQGLGCPFGICSISYLSKNEMYSLKEMKLLFHWRRKGYLRRHLQLVDGRPRRYVYERFAPAPSAGQDL